MRKILSLSVCFLLVSVAAHADMTQNGRQPRQWDQAVSNVSSFGSDYTDNVTIHTNQVLTGNNATGNAGFSAFMAAGPDSVVRTYYVWVDGTANNGAGALRMASQPNIITFSSFPYGDWRTGSGFTAGVKVSAQ